MTRRRVHHAIELDQSLRAARTVYVVAAVIFVPSSLFALGQLVFGVSVLISHFSGSGDGDPGRAVWDIVFSLVIFVLAYISVVQAIEASKRIKMLAEDPTAPVRPMYIPGITRNR